MSSGFFAVFHDFYRFSMVLAKTIFVIVFAVAKPNPDKSFSSRASTLLLA